MKRALIIIVIGILAYLIYKIYTDRQKGSIGVNGESPKSGLTKGTDYANSLKSSKLPSWLNK